MSLGEVIIDFINKNTILVGGGGLFCLSLIVVCLGCVFIVGLKLKHNKLKKRVKRMKERGEEEGKKTKTRKKPGIRVDMYRSTYRKSVVQSTYILTSPFQLSSFYCKRPVVSLQ